MLRPGAVALCAALAAPAAVAGCGDDGGGGEGALAERVLALFAASGGSGNVDLTGAEATCPEVDEPAAGDRATCVVRPAAGERIEVDIEFGEQGSIALVGVVSG